MCTFSTSSNAVRVGGHSPLMPLRSASDTGVVCFRFSCSSAVPLYQPGVTARHQLPPATNPNTAAGLTLQQHARTSSKNPRCQTPIGTLSPILSEESTLTSNGRTHLHQRRSCSGKRDRFQTSPKHFRMKRQESGNHTNRNR